MSPHGMKPERALSWIPGYHKQASKSRTTIHGMQEEERTDTTFAEKPIDYYYYNHSGRGMVSPWIRLGREGDYCAPVFTDSPKISLLPA